MPLHRMFQLLRGFHADPPTKDTAGELPAAPQQAQPPQGAPRLDRLDLQAALIHHFEWCVQFNDQIGIVSGSETPPPRLLPGADSSELGQWLRRSATRAPGAHPLFAELVQEHRQLHLLADRALLLAARGRMDQASTLLNTDFERSRARVQDLLRQMQKS